MACRRCSTCGINYPVSEHVCPVCDDATKYRVDEHDPDWELAVRLRQAQTPSRSQTEVNRWRRRVLSRIGFAGAMLDLLVDSSCDVHEAESLVGSGCPLDTAAQILL